jgi:hypothetical protein
MMKVMAKHGALPRECVSEALLRKIRWEKETPGTASAHQNEGYFTVKNKYLYHMHNDAYPEDDCFECTEHKAKKQG